MGLGARLSAASYNNFISIHVCQTVVLSSVVSAMPELIEADDTIRKFGIDY